MLSPNHMLYRPFGAVALKLIRSLGSNATSAEVPQYVTAVAGGLAVGLFWAWTRSLTGDTVAAGMATVFMATSRAFWRFSTDAHYIVPAAAMVLLALLVASRPPHSRWTVALLACCTALAILIWQANVFLVPAIVLALTQREGPRGRIVLFLGALGAIVVATYVVVGFRAFHLHSLQAFATWVSSHGSRGAVPLWGQWSIDRIPLATRGSLGSILALRTPAGGDTMLTVLAWAALAVLIGLTILVATRRVTTPGPTARRFSWLTAGYASYMAFVVWFDPRDIKWFVIPNLFVFAVLAQVWALTVRGRTESLVIAACVAVIAVANFTNVIWPGHMRSNPNLELARCFAAHAGPQDTVVVTDWNWSFYADSFFGYRGPRLVIGETRDTGLKLGSHQADGCGREA